MKVKLTELENIEGVTKVFLFNKEGDLLLPQLPYTDARTEQMGKEVALCAVLLEKIKQEVDIFELIYEDKHIVVRISNNFFTLVVCDNAADTTLIKLTLNVIHEEAKGDNDLQKSLRKSKGKGDLLAEAQKDSELAELFKRIKVAA
jgi:hypothetical protein